MKLVLSLILIMGTACNSAAPYRCSSNENCVRDDIQGICEVDQACSFPDTACASHQRYGDSQACTATGTACVAEMLGGGTTEGGIDVAHTCVRELDGTVWCWGDNSFGQLGVSGPSQSEVASRVPLPSESTKIAAAQTHTCALLGSGELYCWGDNSENQLGVTNVESSTTPVLVVTPPTKNVGAGGSHTCVVTTATGAVYCWGENGDSQVAASAMDPQPTPIQVQGISKGVVVAAGDQHSCCLSEDSSVFCWGSNALGQSGQGDGSPDHLLVPTQVKALYSVNAIALGDQHSCALLVDSSLVCWGSNVAGSVGNGSDVNATSPVQVMDGVLEVASSGDAKHVCVIKNDETLWCWGNNDSGQLSFDPTIASKSAIPVRIPLSSVKQVAVGAHHTCAATVDGTVWCWGSNHSGQLGIPPSDNIFTPTRASFSCTVKQN